MESKILLLKLIGCVFVILFGICEVPSLVSSNAFPFEIVFGFLLAYIGLLAFCLLWLWNKFYD